MKKRHLFAVLSVSLLFAAACTDRPQMTVDPSPVEANSAVWARFDRPINGRAADQYWIVIAPRGEAADYRDGRLHVVRSAEGVQLEAPATPGDYEVRLHGDWPRLDHNVVRTVPLVVVANPNVVGSL